MSARHGPWRLLGLAPTEDIREVRRAYAARLKAIDVDRDPQAFIALREAFEHAQHLARWMAHQREEENLEAQALEMAEGPGSLQVDLVDAPAHPPAAEPAPSNSMRMPPRLPSCSSATISSPAPGPPRPNGRRCSPIGAC